MRRLNTKKAYCSKKSCACVTDDPGDTYTFISCAHFAYKYQIDVGSLLGILTLQLKEHHTSYSHACTYMHHLYSSPYMCVGSHNGDRNDDNDHRMRMHVCCIFHSPNDPLSYREACE